MSSSSAAAEDYAALMRGAITIYDVTSNDGNAEILHDLKDNSPDLTEIYLIGGNDDDAYPVFDVCDTRGLGVLGCFLGRSENVKGLHVQLPADSSINMIETFMLEFQNNRSIRALELETHVPQDFFRMLRPFFASNTSLVKLDVYNCEMDVQQYRALSLTLREGKSLKEFHISGLSDGGRYDHEESIIDNIEALKMHPQLEELTFGRFSLGRNACTALLDLLRQSSGLQKLILNHSDINDSGIEALMEGLAHCRALTHLSLSYNPMITVRGWRAVSALLEDPGSSLQVLHLEGSGINDQIAILFANALRHNNNNTLEALYLDSDATITSDGWAAFSKVVCDTTSVNHMFLSNHTLHTLEGAGIPFAIGTSLSLNRGHDKKRVAFRKILFFHADFDMQPLFEWDLKALPYVIEWLEQAATYEINPRWAIRNRKLAAIYQFVRGLPELAIDGITGASKKSANVGGEKRPHSTAFEEE